MDIGKIQPTEITAEMEKSYLDYAMSVIVARALPDVRDGLKPVHRRILYAMHQMGLSPGAKYTKSAKIVGETMGKFHPHGDIPIYDSLVRLAQNFSMRYPLVDGQGNFGSMDGDPPAAMRYTEAKLAPITQELLADIEKETVDFIDNFDHSLKEPVFLPAKLPNLLLMGSEGIAVGMATKIPPHNLGEVVDAAVYMIEKGRVGEIKNGKYSAEGKKEKESEIKRIILPDIPDIPDFPETAVFASEATTEELLQFVKGPDFPTGGAIYDQEQILSAYLSGRGQILVRGKAEIEEDKDGRFQIIIGEIPYQVNKARLVARIAQLAKEKKIQGISDLRDESDRQGVRVVVELKRDAKPKSVLNNLFKKTDLQISFPANFVCLVDGVPQTLNLKDILLEYLKHRLKIVTRRSIFELKEARARAHILEGLKIALDNLEAVIETIKKSKDAQEAQKNLITKFSLSELQATAILDMQLRRLAALERQKIEDEYQILKEMINYLTDLLEHPEKILKVIKEELLKLKEKYADPRRTKVFQQKIGEFSEEDLIAREETLIAVTEAGYIKRVAKGTFRTQRRGGKGVSGMATREEDQISHLIFANTHDNILFFTNFGRVFKLRVWELPEASRQAKGQALINLINLTQDEKIQTILTVPATPAEKGQYLLMVTKKGTVKKTSTSQFQNIRVSGLIAIKLEKNDELCWVKPTTGNNDILLVSREGKAIRFSEKGVRPTSRDTQGVRGIRLIGGDFIVGMEAVAEKIEIPKDKRKKVFLDILVVTENGLGKRTSLEHFRRQTRGGQGVKVASLNQRTGKIICCKLVDQGINQVVLTSKLAQVIRLPLKNIPRLGRATQGVILMRFTKGGGALDSVAAATCL